MTWKPETHIGSGQWPEMKAAVDHVEPETGGAVKGQLKTWPENNKMLFTK